MEQKKPQMVFEKSSATIPRMMVQLPAQLDIAFGWR